MVKKIGSKEVKQIARDAYTMQSDLQIKITPKVVHTGWRKIQVTLGFDDSVVYDVL